MKLPERWRLYDDSVSLDLASTSPQNPGQELRRKATDSANSKRAYDLLMFKADAFQVSASRLTSFKSNESITSVAATCGHNDMSHGEYFWGNLRCTRPRLF